MGTEIDRLEVKIEAQARGANQQLENLCKKLELLRNSLSGINASGMTGLADGVSKLATAMVKMNGIKTTDFTRLAKNIQKLGGINAANINSAANAINTISQSLSSISGVTTNAQSVSELAKNIAKLGNKSTSNAIDSLPKLSLALKNMMQTLSAAPQVSNNVIRMTQAMASLASNGSRVSSASANLSTGFRQYTESTKKAASGTKGLSSALGSLYQKYFWVKRLFTALSKSITSSMDYIEEYNYYNVTMDKVAAEWQGQWQKYGYDNAKSYAASFQGRMSELLGKMTGYSINTNGTLTDTQTQNLGLDVKSLTNYSAGLMQVTNSLGLTGEASETTSKALTMLAGDMSSFRNLDLKTVMTNFQSGLIGQSRSLYKYGIDITNATLQTYAYENGITKAVSEMTQAEKMQLRLIAILDQSKVAWGDLADTINSPSNQIRLLKNNFSALSRTIGNIFLPVVAKVLPYVNGLVIAVRRLFTWIGSLLGVDLSEIISNSSAGYSDGFEDLADDADEASSAIDGVGKSAKEANKQLASFDELNNFTTNDSSSAGSASKGAGDTIDLTDQLTAALADYESVWNKAFEDMENTANKYADSVVGFFAGIAKYAEPSVDSVKRLWNDGLKKFRNFAATGAQDFLDEFLIPLGKWTLGKGFPMLVDATNDFLNDIDWKMLNKNLKNFWKVLEPFAEGVGEGLITFYRGITAIGAMAINAVGKAIGVFSDYALRFSPDIIKKTGEAFGILLGALITFKTLVSLQKGIQNVGITITTFIKTLTEHPYLVLAGEIATLTVVLYDFFENTDKLNGGQAVTPFYELRDGVQSALMAAQETIDSFNQSISDISSKYGYIKGIADEYYELSKNYNNLTDEQKNLLQSYSEILKENVNGVEEYIDPITSAYNGTKEELDDLIESTEKYYITLAAKDKIVETGQALIELKQNVNNLTDELNNRLNQGLGNSQQSFLDWQKIALNGSDESLKNLINALIDVNYDYESLSNTNKELYERQYATNEMFRAYMDILGDIPRNLAAADGQAQTTQTTIEELTEIIATNGDCWEKNTKNTIQKYSDLQASIENSDDCIEESNIHATENMENSYNNATEQSKQSLSGFYSHAKGLFSQMGIIGASGGTDLSDNFQNNTSGLNNYTDNLFSQLYANIIEKSSQAGNDGGENITNNMKNSMNNLPNMGENAVKNMGSYMNQAASSVGDDTGKTIGEGISGGIFSKRTGIRGILDKIFGGYTFDIEANNIGSSGGSFSISSIGHFAMGGFPQMGQIFLARENGPEYVGTMGGHTAVANNDQIVEGIADGIYPAVYNAFMQALSRYNTNGSNNIQVFVGGKEITDVVVKDINEATMMTGECPILF